MNEEIINSMLEELKKIHTELKELNNRVLTRTNNSVVFSHDTATTKTYQVSDILGQRYKANDLSIVSLGGGFTIAINAEEPITATLDYAIEHEDIYTVRIVGAGAGTAELRIGSYTPKYYQGDGCNV